MPWPWKQKQAALPPPAARAPTDDDDLRNNCDSANLMMVSEQKTFDWMHYQAITQGSYSPQFASEFNIVPSIRIMKSLYLQEFWINACVGAIMRQFLTARFALTRQAKADGKIQIVKQHPLLSYLRNASSEIENQSYFVANSVSDFILGGNAYWWTSDDLKLKRRIPCERVDPVIQDNKIIKYRIIDRADLGGGIATEIPPEQMTHIRYPNPYSPHVGLSMIVATILPVLIDKYGAEYVVGFFTRGGSTAGIIETDTNDLGQLSRLARSIMQAFGGRRNMHADKILPKGATWKGQGNTFSQIGLAEVIKANLSKFRAATGCTNMVLGMSEQVTRAAAFAEMEFFYLATILPLQKLFCMGVEGSSLWKRFGLDDTWELQFDNSHVIYLDDFDRKIDQDKGLAGCWTINERRERLGKTPIDGGDVIAATKPPPFGAPPANFNGPVGATKASPGWKATELVIQDPPSTVEGVFQAEFEAWETLALTHAHERSLGIKAVLARAPFFAGRFAEAALPGCLAAYDNQRAHVKAFRSKESAQGRQEKLDLLRERADQVIEDRVMSNGMNRFVGYAENQMNDLYDVIDQGLADGDSLDEIATSVRGIFGEAYQGQAQTIVRTEYGSALSLGQEQFADDLATVTSVMKKTWVTMGDNHVRDSHAELNGVVIEGESGALVDLLFDNGLRYPRDPDAQDPAEVINCRCTIQFEPVEWSQ